MTLLRSFAAIEIKEKGLTIERMRQRENIILGGRYSGRDENANAESKKKICGREKNH